MDIYVMANRERNNYFNGIAAVLGQTGHNCFRTGRINLVLVTI